MSMMTKKHFESFAHICRQWRMPADLPNSPIPTETRQLIAIAIENAVVDVSLDDNPRFDAARFRKACNPAA